MTKQDRIKLFISGSLLLILILIAWSPWTRPGKEDRVRLFSNGFYYSSTSQPVEFYFANYRYRVPKNNLLDPVSTTCSRSSLGLVGMLPDFEGVTKSNYKNISSVTQDDPTMWVLMNTIYKGADLEGGDLKPLLESFRGNFSTKSSYTRTRKYGLEVLSEKYKDTILYANRSGKVPTLIVCDMDVPNPGCSQYFIINNASIKLSYRLKYLSQWAALEEKMRIVLAPQGPMDSTIPSCGEK